ncbi:BMP family ABC transporter substrate-binding protein [Leeia aquatica]|uniref:BMP family ABC transporter substrate-binding protein n=1 Tax=Leeia aquatica TaxID=2725557 RepID=A0A847S1M2_9NEIS|nr:BMP family ABC transporter substrate-binding protein [Leeia aquatica]NLR73614.1 BMP family ABC transporter substrate-binding protein [Leeia aquatica]
MVISRRTVLKQLTAALVVSGVIGVAHAAEPFKVGFVYVGPVGDAGWTYAHDQGRQAVEKMFPGKVKTTFVESVPEGADAERVIRKLAQDGNKVIFTTSFGYMNPTLKVAKQFPNTVFLHATGFKSDKNVGTYDVRTYEGAYLAGYVAGLTSKTSKLGVVASVPIPEVVRNIDAFTLGARANNPKATVKVIWINSWYDPAKERQAAETLIAQGVDTLMQNTDSAAVVQTAQEKKVKAFGWDSDMTKFGADAHLAASQINWGVYYTKAVKAAMDGNWKNEPIWWGLKEGMIDLGALNKSLPDDVKKKVAARRADIISGKAPIFAGPIKDNTGAVKVAAGKTMSDGDMHGITWYVEGVEGTVPK